jgi:hypothetical protein
LALWRIGLFIGVSAAAGAAAALLHWGAGAPAAASRARDVTAEQILRAYKKVKTPAFSSGSSPEALETFHRELEVGLAKRNALALELATRFPNHPKVGELMWTRWSNRIHFSHEAADVARETEATIAKAESPALRDTARAARAMAGLEMAEIDPARRTAWVLDAADAKNVAVDVVPDLLEWLATRFDVEPGAQRRLLERAAGAAGESRSATGAWLALSGKLGAPIVGIAEMIPELSRALEAARGKVVLLHLANVTRDEERSDIVGIAELWKSSRTDLAAITLEAWGEGERGAEARVCAKKVGIDWPFVVDASPFGATFASRLGIRGTPCFLLVDRDGNIAAFATRFAAIRERALALGMKPK